MPEGSFQKHDDIFSLVPSERIQSYHNSWANDLESCGLLEISAGVVTYLVLFLRL